jgi:two-component system, NtrC family, sensor histidine kinase HydH
MPLSASFSLRRRFAATSLIVIVGIALGLGWLLSDMLTERMLRREGEVSMEFIRNLLVTDRSADFLRSPEDKELRQRFLGSMEHLSSMTEPVRANAFGADGTMLWSTDRDLIGRRDADNPELQEALHGDLVVHSGTLGKRHEKQEHQGLSQQTHYYVESYIPILADDKPQVLGVIELYKVPVQLSAAIREAVLQLWVACAGSAVVLFLALNGVVVRADRIMREQQNRISESQALSSAVELAGAVAHNLRNPLASIRTAAEMMDGSPAHQADQAEHREDIIQSVDRANRWITELVRVSHASQLPLAPVATTPMWRDCLQELQPEMTRQRVLWQLQEGEAPEVLAHAPMLRQILLSVLANAIEAMPRGGALAVGWQVQEGHLHITVDDAGSGVSEEVRQALFRPFFSTKSGGLGIGLALARRTLGQWDGTIDLFSRNGAGSRVVITLPVAPAEGS